MRRIFLALLFLLIGGAVFLLLLLLEPRTDRVWIEEQARTPYGSIEGDAITLHNVRDWTYAPHAPLSKDWMDVEVDTNTITRAWFLIEPFSDLDVIGHTFLSFEFQDGTTLSFSVEARREEGETYSALRGLGPTYELAYQWGTERDFIARRLVYLDHPVRMYPLQLSEADTKALFHSLVEETNSLKERPRFYNTLTANCTNVLAQIVNRHYPGTLPYDAAWNFTGLADQYLMREGLLLMDGSEEETMVRHDLTPYKDRVAGMATTTSKEFSVFIRDLLEESAR